MLSVVLLIIGVQYCMNVVFVVLLIIGVQYCMNVVCSSLYYRCTIVYECCLCIVHLKSRELQTTFIQYCTPIIKRKIQTTFIQYCTPVFVVLLIIGVQYCMNVVCSSPYYRCTIVYECCLCSSLDNRCTILYDTYNKENYRQHSYNIVHLWSRELQRQHSYNIVHLKSRDHLIIGVQYCMNVVCSSLDYRCTILYECCLCSSLDYRCTILYACCLCCSLDYRCTIRQYSCNIVHL
jgi:hypothetical protein